MSAPTAFVLLSPNPKASPPAIVADLAATFPAAAAVTFTVDAETGALNFQIGAVTVSASILPIPAPAAQLAPCYRASWLWPTAEADLRDHAMILTITAAGGDSAVERMVALTMLVASVIGTCPQAAGVLWDGADHLIRADVFREFAVRQLPHQLPLLMWVGVPLGTNPDGTSSGHTVGLAQFGLAEMETSDAPASMANLRQRFADLAEHQIVRGVQIPDGAVIGESATQRVTVSYGESRFGLPGRVLRLQHQQIDPQGSG